MMNEFGVSSKRGKVISFSLRTGEGSVVIGDSNALKILPFHTMYFHSKRPYRAPTVGQRVDVLFTMEGELLSVRAV